MSGRSKLKLSHVRDNNHKLGDALLSKYKKKGDLNIAVAAITAYRLSIRAAKMQLMYKHLTGSPKRIDYIE